MVALIDVLKGRGDLHQVVLEEKGRKRYEAFTAGIASECDR